MIKLMYITNNPKVAEIAQDCGVDIIFIDMEYIGKGIRQGGMDTVQSHHTIEDIKKVRKVINKSKILVRCNPIHDKTCDHCSTEEEIDRIIEAGADIVMLPFFKTKEDIERFVKAVGGRAKTLPLLENSEAYDNIDEILQVDGIDGIYIGLNDLSLSYGQKFMFQPLAESKVDVLAAKLKEKNIPFGFGGVASVGQGLIPGEMIIKEHYRLGSNSVILSRSFCNAEKAESLEAIRNIFEEGIPLLREKEKECIDNLSNADYFAENHKQIKENVKKVLSIIGGK